MSTSAELKNLASSALSTDLRTALSACRRLTNNELPWCTERAAQHARRAGWSWRMIGQLLDVSGQAARKRLMHLDQPAPPSLRGRSDRWAEAEHRTMAANARQLRLAQELGVWERSGGDNVPW